MDNYKKNHTFCTIKKLISSNLSLSDGRPVWVVEIQFLLIIFFVTLHFLLDLLYREKCFQGLVLTSGALHPLSNIPQFSHLTRRFLGCGIVDLPFDLEFKDFP